MKMFFYIDKLSRFLGRKILGSVYYHPVIQSLYVCGVPAIFLINVFGTIIAILVEAM